MENIVIRNIKESDIEKVADIHVNGWKTAYAGIIDDAVLNSMDKAVKAEQIRRSYTKNGFIVAETGGSVAGFCVYVDSNKYTSDMPEIDCELSAIYVEPSLKYNGIGTRMFQYVLDEFKGINRTKMIVWCLKDNIPAVGFYEKMGGRLVKERKISIGGKDYLELGFEYTV